MSMKKDEKKTDSLVRAPIARNPSEQRREIQVNSGPGGPSAAHGVTLRKWHSTAVGEHCGAG